MHLFDLLSNKINYNSFTVCLIIFSTLLMIFDSTIISIYLNIAEEPKPVENAYTFLILCVFFVTINIFLLRYIQSSRLIPENNTTLIRYLQKSIIIIQFFISTVLVVISFQTLLFGYTDVIFIFTVTYVSNIVTIVFLTIIDCQFIRWFFSNKNTLILSYCIAFLLVTATSILSTIYLGNNLAHYDSEVRLSLIKTQISGYTNYGENIYTLTELYNYLSLVSFVSLWIPSIYLLKSYSSRLGKIKFYAIATLSMLYFVLPFLANQFGLFDSYISVYDTQFNLIYYLIFSPYKQIGGLLFGIIFWVLAKKIKRTTLQILVKTAGLGMILLFGSQVIYGLTYIISPPFGLVTISFQTLASYMVLLGIFLSAKELSLDARIRKELYRTGKESMLLQNISIAELEKIFEKKMEKIVKENSLALDNPKDNITDNEDYAKYAKDIIEQLEKAKSEK